MTMQEAMSQRHTVRRYTDRPLSQETIRRLTARIQTHNEDWGLSMRLMTERTDAFGPLLRLFFAKGVRNYILLAHGNQPDGNRNIGYCGADLMLFAQTLGLNTWWVGGTYRRGALRKNTAASETLLGLIAVGYGAVPGVPHKSKGPEDIALYNGTPPEWFTKGVQAVLLAPTVLNRQAFTIRGSGRRVSMAYQKGPLSGIDLGIGQYHFELGAGTEHFQWASENDLP